MELAGDAARRLRRERAFKLELLCAALAHRRRAVACAAVLTGLPSGQGPQGPKPVPEWQAFVWEQHVARLTESDFKLRYRLTADAFHYDLLPRVRPHLVAGDEEKVRAAKWGQVVRPETKLAVGLRFLAGGDPIDLKLIYDVSKNYVYKCVWWVVDGVNASIVISFPIYDAEKLKVLEAEFRAASRQGVWAGQVGAVDGVHFPMQAPTKEDVADPLKYYVSRKAEYALLCIAVCDAARRFTAFDISQVPRPPPLDLTWKLRCAWSWHGRAARRCGRVASRSLRSARRQR